jgi:hypothetical protein
MLEEMIQRIDCEISKAKERGRHSWFDHDINTTGIIDKIRTYYMERGYKIEILPCRACLGQKSDIIILW